jgi:hypothetical protein
MASQRTSELRPDFLPPAAPEGANMRKVDWASDETMVEYKDYIAVVIDNILTESECQELIKIAEASTVTSDSPTPKWGRAMVNAGNGKETMATDTRNCGRILFDSPLIAERLLNRLRPFINECGVERIYQQSKITGLGPWKRKETLQISRLNERLRFLKYEGG